MLGYPEKADPEIASATFAAHLNKFWAGSIPVELGLSRQTVDALHTLIGFEGVRADGKTDPYFVLLGAEFYDRWPPTAAFVDPDTLTPAADQTKWWPLLKPNQNPPWAALHNSYQFQLDGKTGQMICFTFTAEYYRAQHSPSEHAVWQQGRHTVAATISRLAELLRQPYYDRPSA